MEGQAPSIARAPSEKPGPAVRGLSSSRTAHLSVKRAGKPWQAGLARTAGMAPGQGQRSVRSAWGIDRTGAGFADPPRPRPGRPSAGVGAEAGGEEAAGPGEDGQSEGQPDRSSLEAHGARAAGRRGCPSRSAVGFILQRSGREMSSKDRLARSSAMGYLGDMFCGPNEQRGRRAPAASSKAPGCSLSRAHGVFDVVANGDCRATLAARHDRLQAGGRMSRKCSRPTGSGSARRVAEEPCRAAGGSR